MAIFYSQWKGPAENIERGKIAIEIGITFVKWRHPQWAAFSYSKQLGKQKAVMIHEENYNKIFIWKMTVTGK